MAEVGSELCICEAVYKSSVAGSEALLEGAKVGGEVLKGIFLIDVEKGEGDEVA
jgi:hypothetical protein